MFVIRTDESQPTGTNVGNVPNCRYWFFHSYSSFCNPTQHLVNIADLPNAFWIRIGSGSGSRCLNCILILIESPYYYLLKNFVAFDFLSQEMNLIRVKRCRFWYEIQEDFKCFLSRYAAFSASCPETNKGGAATLFCSRWRTALCQTFSVADPDPGSGAFLTPGSGMSKKSGSGSGMNNPDHISESLETSFGVKILNFFYGDPGWKKFGSGMEKIRIRDKHPGSATLLTLFNLVDDCVDGLQCLEPWTKYI